MNSFTRRFTLLLMLCSFWSSAYSTRLDDLKVTRYTTLENFLSNVVYQIKQDSVGFLWMATDNGLVRYDGYQFKTYHSDHKSPKYFSTNIFYSLAVDADGLIWLGTARGLVLFNPTTEEVLSDLSISISDARVLDLQMISETSLLVVSSKGVFILDTKTHEFMKICPFSSLTAFDDGEFLWIGTTHRGLVRYSKTEKNFVIYESLASKGINNITGIVKDKKGNLWLATWLPHALFCIKEPLNPETDNYISYKANANMGLPSDAHFGVDYDVKNNLLYVATAEGLALLDLNQDTNEFVKFQADILGSEVIKTVFVDRQHVLWCSSQGHALCKLVLKPQTFSHISSPDKSHNLMVTSMYQIDKNTLWLGNRKNIMYSYDLQQGELTSYNDMPILSELFVQANAVKCIHKDRKRNDTYWIGTRYDGVYMLTFRDGKPAKMNRLREKKKVMRNIMAITQDSTGTLWIGAQRGCFKIPYEKEIIIKQVADVNKLIKNSAVTCLCVDDEALWIGTGHYGVIRRLKKNRLATFNVENKGLNFKAISSLKLSSNKSLFVGTMGGGVSRYNRQKEIFEPIQKLTDLSNSMVYSILEDKNQDIWLSTERGVVKLDGHTLEVLATYNSQNGLDNRTFFPNSCIELQDGRLAWGGYNGVDILDAQVETEERETPKIAVTSLRVDNNPIVGAPYVKNIVLDYDQDNFSLTMACLSFYDVDGNRYAYKLEGLDSRWHNTNASEGTITYNISQSGDYKLHLKACDERGIWSEPTSIRIKKLSPPWFTWWAWTTYAILLILIAVLVYYEIRRRVRLVNKIKYEQIERKKSEEMNQMKLQFFTNISHELFTPISVLYCGVDSLKEQVQHDSETVRIMQSNLERLKRLLQQIMEFRKSESGSLKLQVSEGDIVQFVKKLCCESFQPLLVSKQIRLEYDVVENSTIGWFDYDKLDKILYNLISNAIKYNIPNGYVRIKLRVVDRVTDSSHAKEHVTHTVPVFEVSVTNSGHGISPEKMNSLFTRFYDGAYRAHHTTGTGIGLSLTKDLVTLHKGTINVESSIDEETVFTVAIPITLDSYDKSEILNSEDESSDYFDSRSSNKLVDSTTDIDNVDGQKLNSSDKPTILIVEDEDDLLRMIIKSLEKSFNIISAVNGVNALDVLKKESGVQLVVTDYMMPEMDGVTLCNEIRSNEELTHLPVVMLTAKTAVEDQLIGLKSGADLYLTKPFEVSVLELQIQNILRQIVRTRKRFQEADTIEESVASTNGLPQFEQEFVKQVLAVVEENMEDFEFNNDTFCTIMGMSQSTLYRRLKDITGLSPNEFIRSVKIKKACELIQQNPRQRVKEIAYQIGIADSKYFSTLFKKVKGVTPSVYAQKYESAQRIGGEKAFPFDSK